MMQTPSSLVPVSSVRPTSPRPLHSLQIGIFFGQDAGSGGLDRVYSDLVVTLPTEGIKVTGVVRGPSDACTHSGGHVHPFASPKATMPRRFLGARRTIIQMLRQHDVDLVACHFALYGAVALDRLRERPLVIHFHGPWSGEAAAEGAGAATVAVKRAVERAVYSRADRVIVLSQAFGDLIVRDFGVREDRLRLVPGHVDVARFAIRQSRREARITLGLPTDRPLLLTVRRLTSRMGIDRLLSAMPAVVKAIPDVLLCIGGKGHLRSALERQVKESGLKDHVRFLGFVPEDELPLLFRAVDFNLLPSVALEGFGLVAAEALAAGTPSLVTPVGGLPEVVAPLSPDLVFPSNAATDIGHTLIAVLRGNVSVPDEAACRAYAAQRFNISVATARTAAVYRDAF